MNVGYVQVHQPTALVVLWVLCALPSEAVPSCSHEGPGIKDDQLTVGRGCEKGVTEEFFVVLGTLQQVRWLGCGECSSTYVCMGVVEWLPQYNSTVPAAHVGNVICSTVKPD